MAEDLYTIGEWKGLPNYKCRHCPFSTLDEAEIREHVLKRHAPRPPQRRVVPELVDRFGNPVTVLEAEDGEE